MKRRKKLTSNKLFLDLTDDGINVEDATDLVDLFSHTFEGEVLQPSTPEKLIQIVMSVNNFIQERAEKVYYYGVALRNKENQRLNKKRIVFDFHEGDFCMA